VKIERSQRKPAARQSEDMIILVVAGLRFGIAATAVEEIRNPDGMKPYKPAFLSKLGKIKYTIARAKKGSATMNFVVDAGEFLHLGKSCSGRLLILRETTGALLVDSVDRMAQIASVLPLPQAFQGDECKWYRGLAIVDGQVVPVLNPDAILSKGEAAVLMAEGKSMPAAAGAHR
jgi:chemotaxis signal transduction protein